MLGQGDIISDEALYNNLQSLKEFIDSLKITDEDVIILQEVPHKILVDKTTVPWV